MKTVFKLLICLLGISCTTYAQAQTNVALGKSAKQSSTYSSGPGKSFPAALALDGVKEGFGKLSHTQQEAGAWWEVDLGERYDISAINIFNATDHPQRMNNFTILISDTPFTGNTGGVAFVSNENAPNPTKTYSGNAQGRYVRIFLNGTNYLTIHEIEVMGILSSASSAGNMFNIAKGKSARQSSTWGTHTANFAVDGDTRDRHTGAGNNYTTTNNDANAWWEVDLGANYDISQINVFNVTDRYGERLKDLNINVSRSPFISNYDGVSFASNVYPAPKGEYKGNATGRYVRLHITRTGYLNLCEVQVMGTPSAANGGGMAASSRSHGFVNEGNLPIKINVNGEYVATLPESNRVHQIPVKDGDEITVTVVEEGQQFNRDRHGFAPTIINEATKNPLVIRAELAYSYGGDGIGLKERNVVNFLGLDLTQLDPMNLQAAFKTSGKIFDGLRTGTYMYYQNGGKYLPAGFGTKNAVDAGDGDFAQKTFIGENKMKEAWSIGIETSGAVGAQGVEVSGGVGFKYGEELVENSSNTDVFITSKETRYFYDLEITDYDKVILDKDFVRAIDNIKTAADANRVVDTYGTHFTDAVVYGAVFNSVIRIHEDTYYKANAQNLSITQEIGVAADVEAAKAEARGKYSFDHLMEQSEREVFEEIDSKYWYVGGNKVGNEWQANKDNSVPVKLGTLRKISDLVRPSILKSASNEDQLGPIRDLLEKAIDNKLKGIKYLEKPRPYRSFQYRIKKMEYIAHPDDANTNSKGNVTAQVIAARSNQTISKETLWNCPEYRENNIGGLTSRQGIHLTRNNKVKQNWFVAKQYGNYVGSGKNNETSFEPLNFKLSGTIFDFDDINSYQQMILVGSDTRAIKNTSGRYSYDFEIAHKPSGIRLKVEIEIVPMVGF